MSYGSRRSCSFSSVLPLRSGFHDDRHLEYYGGGISVRCGSKMVKKNNKRLKMVKGLCKELTMLSKMEFDGDEVVGSVGEAEGTRAAVSPFSRYSLFVRLCFRVYTENTI